MLRDAPLRRGIFAKGVNGGHYRTRTCDFRRVKAAFYQLN